MTATFQSVPRTMTASFYETRMKDSETDTTAWTFYLKEELEKYARQTAPDGANIVKAVSDALDAIKDAPRSFEAVQSAYFALPWVNGKVRPREPEFGEGKYEFQYERDLLDKEANPGQWRWALRKKLSALAYSLGVEAPGSQKHYVDKAMLVIAGAAPSLENCERAFAELRKVIEDWKKDTARRAALLNQKEPKMTTTNKTGLEPIKNITGAIVAEAAAERASNRPVEGDPVKPDEQPADHVDQPVTVVDPAPDLDKASDAIPAAQPPMTEDQARDECAKLLSNYPDQAVAFRAAVGWKSIKVALVQGNLQCQEIVRLVREYVAHTPPAPIKAAEPEPAEAPEKKDEPPAPEPPTQTTALVVSEKAAQIATTRVVPNRYWLSNPAWQIDPFKLAEFAAKSGLFSQVKSPEAALIIIFKGLELGVSPMVALESISLINGKPTVSSALMLALLRKEGVRVEFTERSDKACTLKMTRPDSGESVTVTYTIDDARKAGVASKATWQQYTRAMLTWRAVSEAARLIASDIMAFGSIPQYTTEEMLPDATYNEDGELVAA